MGMMGLAAGPLASPALAHDSLVGSDPASGEEVTELPESATLTFSGELIEIAPQANILADSGEVTPADISLDGRDAFVALPADLAPGEYQVAYSVVSSDGHRIEGAVPFTLVGEASEASDPASEPATEPASEPTSEPASEPATEPASETSSEGASDAPADADEPDDTTVNIIRYTGIFIVFFGLSFILMKWWKNRR